MTTGTRLTESQRVCADLSVFESVRRQLLRSQGGGGKEKGGPEVRVYFGGYTSERGR